MSFASRKGGDFENETVDWLKEIWPDAHRPRLKGIYDRGDVDGTKGWLVECKKRETWALPAWIKTIYVKLGVGNGVDDGGYPWLLCFAKDRRKLEGSFVVMPTHIAQELLYIAKDADPEFLGFTWEEVHG